MEPVHTVNLMLFVLVFGTIYAVYRIMTHD